MGLDCWFRKEKIRFLLFVLQIWRREGDSPDLCLNRLDMNDYTIRKMMVSIRPLLTPRHGSLILRDEYDHELPLP